MKAHEGCVSNKLNAKLTDTPFEIDRNEGWHLSRRTLLQRSSSLLEVRDELIKTVLDPSAPRGIPGCEVTSFREISYLIRVTIIESCDDIFNRNHSPSFDPPNVDVHVEFASDRRVINQEELREHGPLGGSFDNVPF